MEFKNMWKNSKKKDMKIFYNRINMEGDNQINVNNISSLISQQNHDAIFLF